MLGSSLLALETASQGVPGSGKSTRAQQLASQHKAVVCSTDTFFMRQGTYVFEKERLSEYHKRNLQRASALLDEGRNVVVDNTNVQRWEAREYVRKARQLHINIVFERANGRWPNAHSVPAERIEVMRASLEDLDVESVLASLAPWERDRPLSGFATSPGRPPDRGPRPRLPTTTWPNSRGGARGGGGQERGVGFVERVSAWNRTTTVSSSGIPGSGAITEATVVGVQAARTTWVDAGAQTQVGQAEGSRREGEGGEEEGGEGQAAGAPDLIVLQPLP